MTERLILNEHDRKMMVKFIEGHKLPCTIKVENGRKRSVEQNRLQRLWCHEISEQTGDTPEEVRGFLKLSFGVPILCAGSDEFREAYERDIAPLPYLRRLALMRAPHDYAITRNMTVKQKKQYLDDIQKHCAEAGLILTNPDLQGMAA